MQAEQWMSCGVLAIGFLYLFLVTFLPVPEAGQEHAKTIVGFLLGSVISIVIGYWWGSSKGSSEKSKVIETQMKKGQADVSAALKDGQKPEPPK